MINFCGLNKGQILKFRLFTMDKIYEKSYGDMVFLILLV